MLENFHDVLDINDICQILRISRKTAYRLVKDGHLPCRRIGRIYKVSKESLISYINKNN